MQENFIQEKKNEKSKQGSVVVLVARRWGRGGMEDERGAYLWMRRWYNLGHLSHTHTKIKVYIDRKQEKLRLSNQAHIF